MDAELGSLHSMQLPAVPNDKQMVTLVVDGGLKLQVHKAVLCLASHVLRHAVEVEPGVMEIKVEGCHRTWQDILALIHPSLPPLPSLYMPGPRTPPKLWHEAAMLPLAHRYQINRVIAHCVARVKQCGLGMQAGQPDYVLTWLEWAEELPVPDLFEPCVECLAACTKALVWRRHSGARKTDFCYACTVQEAPGAGRTLRQLVTKLSAAPKLSPTLLGLRIMYKHLAEVMEPCVCKNYP